MYPFGHHETFLDMELLYLAQKFDEIVISPNLSGSNSRSVPENVIIDTSMSLKQMGKLRYFIRAIFSISPLLFKEIMNNLKFYVFPKAIWRSLSYMEEASRIQRYLNNLNKAGELKLENTIFYTYWLRGQALGVSLFKEKFPELVFVSRAHGGDLYEERYQPPYLPFRKNIIQSLDKLFVISEDGLKYIRKKNEDLDIPVIVSHLGVEDPGVVTETSSENCISLLSCSSILPIKRLELLVCSLREFAMREDNLNITWNHLGDGLLIKTIQKLAKQELAENVSWKIHGQLSHKEVLAFYKNNPIDVFLNLSSSEGISVAIMEAQSFGVPVIATAVGGTPEIVNNQNGRLLNPDPSPDEVASAIQDIFAEDSEIRVNSRKHWEYKFNANDNYSAFIKELKSLLD